MRTCKVNIQSFNGNKSRKNVNADSNETVDSSNEKFSFEEGRDKYWDSVFSSYEKMGAVTIKEEVGWIDFSDMVSYVEWKKGK